LSVFRRLHVKRPAAGDTTPKINDLGDEVVVDYNIALENNASPTITQCSHICLRLLDPRVLYQWSAKSKGRQAHHEPAYHHRQSRHMGALMKTAHKTKALLQVGLRMDVEVHLK
jgi:hypothetical protein